MQTFFCTFPLVWNNAKGGITFFIILKQLGSASLRSHWIRFLQKVYEKVSVKIFFLLYCTFWEKQDQKHFDKEQKILERLGSAGFTCFSPYETLWRKARKFRNLVKLGTLWLNHFPNLRNSYALCVKSIHIGSLFCLTSQSVGINRMRTHTRKFILP